MGLQPFRYDMQRGRAATLSSLSEIARFQEVPPVFGEALSSNFKYIILRVKKYSTFIPSPSRSSLYAHSYITHNYRTSKSFNQH